MSAAAKKRANLKSRGTDKDEPPAETIENQPTLENADDKKSSMKSLKEESKHESEEGDHLCFEQCMLKPSNLRDIWTVFKVKKAMVDFMTWYFRPKSSYEPERVEYNAINILAEYQTYNLEYCKNELALNDEQCANVLDALWQLLEFDPDSKSIEQELAGSSPKQVATKNQTPENNIAYLGDDMVDAEEEAFKTLLHKKFELFKRLIAGMIEH